MKNTNPKSSSRCQRHHTITSIAWLLLAVLLVTIASHPAQAQSIWSRRLSTSAKNLSSYTGINVTATTTNPASGTALELWLQTADGIWWRSSETVSLSQSTNTGQITFANLSRVQPTGPSSPDLSSVKHIAVGQTNLPPTAPSFQVSSATTYGGGTLGLGVFSASGAAGGENVSGGEDDDDCVCPVPATCTVGGGLPDKVAIGGYWTEDWEAITPGGYANKTWNGVMSCSSWGACTDCEYNIWPGNIGGGGYAHIYWYNTGGQIGSNSGGCRLYFFNDRWTLELRGPQDGNIWTGEKTFGSSVLGTFTRTSGTWTRPFVEIVEPLVTTEYAGIPVDQEHPDCATKGYTPAAFRVTDSTITLSGTRCEGWNSGYLIRPISVSIDDAMTAGYYNCSGWPDRPLWFGAVGTCTADVYVDQPGGCVSSNYFTTITVTLYMLVSNANNDPYNGVTCSFRIYKTGGPILGDFGAYAVSVAQSYRQYHDQVPHGAKMSIEHYGSGSFFLHPAP